VRRRRSPGPKPPATLSAAKLPANVFDPDARLALPRARRHGLQMVLRLLGYNAEHWLSNHLNAYLQDDDEYRAITRQTIIRGLAGTITCTPRAITVELGQPGEPRVTRALALLLDEINANPPSMPGDPRPITYHLTARPSAFDNESRPTSGDLGPRQDVASIDVREQVRQIAACGRPSRRPLPSRSHINDTNPTKSRINNKPAAAPRPIPARWLTPRPNTGPHRA
jgi:hypothetical protein